VIVKVGDHVKNLKPGMRAGYKVSSLPRPHDSKAMQYSELMILTQSSQSKIPADRVSSVVMATNATAQKLFLQAS
jgi:hypothetical protein